MNALIWFGKMLTLAFWWVVLVNIFVPLGQPFEPLIHLAGAALLGLHVLELIGFNRRLRGRSHPGIDRLQILLIGIFHVVSLPRAVEPTR